MYVCVRCLPVAITDARFESVSDGFLGISALPVRLLLPLPLPPPLPLPMLLLLEPIVLEPARVGVLPTGSGVLLAALMALAAAALL